MAFWSAPVINMDPKRNFRFKVTFSNVAGSQAPVYLAQSVDRPVPTVSGNTKIDFLDKSFNFPGKVTWNDVKIKFVDGADRDENMAVKAYNFLAAAGFIGVVSGYGEAQTVHKTISKAAARIDLAIEALSTNGTTLETYVLNNAFITSTALSGFDYSTEGISTAEFTFKYDWAEVKNVV